MVRDSRRDRYLTSKSAARHAARCSGWAVGRARCPRNLTWLRIQPSRTSQPSQALKARAWPPKRARGVRTTLPLFDTITGLIDSMLVLNMLVKSLTALIKNHVDLHSHNLNQEAGRLVLSVVGRTWNHCVAPETNPATRQDAAWSKASTGNGWETNCSRRTTCSECSSSVSVRWTQYTYCDGSSLADRRRVMH